MLNNVDWQKIAWNPPFPFQPGHYLSLKPVNDMTQRNPKNLPTQCCDLEQGTKVRGVFSWQPTDSQSQTPPLNMINMYNKAFWMFIDVWIQIIRSGATLA